MKQGRREVAIFWDCATEPFPATAERVYIGNEFCDKALPAGNTLQDALQSCENHGVKATFVTSFMTEEGLRNTAGLLEIIKGVAICDEIVVNDWGFLSIVGGHVPQKKLIAGRLLVSRFFFGHDDTADAERPSSMDAGGRHFFPDEFISFLIGHRVNALEFNSRTHAQAVERQLQECGMAAHLYVPYAYVTTSRFCSAAHRFRSFPPRPDFVCAKECGQMMAHVVYEKSARPMIIRGNTYFIYQEPVKPENEPLVLGRIIMNTSWHNADIA